MQKNLSFYTFFYLGGLIMMRVCGILAKILLARSITPYEYGLITLLIIALPGTLQVITNFCFFDIMGHSVEGKKYFSFSLIYGMITSLIILFVFLLFPEAIFQFLNLPSAILDSLERYFVWSSPFRYPRGGHHRDVTRAKIPFTCCYIFCSAQHFKNCFYHSGSVSVWDY